MYIDGTVGAFAEDPAFELAAIERTVAWAEHGHGFGHGVSFIHRCGHDDLEDGTGRELCLYGAIQQRLLLIRVQTLPFFLGDADGEIVGIWRRTASHRQDLAAARIQRYDSAFTPGQRLLGNLLQVVIDGQRNLLARDGFLAGQTIDFFSDAVDDDAAHAVGAHQDVVVLALESGFAAEVAGPQLAVAGFELLLAHFTNIPGSVRHEAARNVAAARNGE